MIPESLAATMQRTPADEADPGDETAAIDVVGAVVLVHAEAAEARKLEKGRIAVEQPVEALARRQLPAGAELVVGARGGVAHLALEGAEFGDQLEMRDAIGAERLAFDDDVRRDRRHAVAPSAAACVTPRARLFTQAPAS